MSARVSHYTFLDTCTEVGKATLGVYCDDAAGVDRDKVHAKVSAMRWSSSTIACAEVAAAAEVLFLVEYVFVGGGPPLLPPEVEAVDDVAGEPLLTDLGPGLILFGVPESRQAG